MKTYPHLMLDLETMGDTSDAAIVSIAAIEFDINTGETGREFYKKVDLQSSIDAGGIVSAKTIQWWLMQNEAAKIEILKEGQLLTRVVYDLHIEFGSHYEVFSKPSGFDIPILKHAFHSVGVPYPFNHRLERCVRTYISLRPDIASSIEFTGIPHHALHDCHHQIKQVCAVHQSLNLNPNGQHNQIS